MRKGGIISIIGIALFACLLFCTPVSAQGNPGAGCPSETKFYDTIHGGIYFEQHGWWNGPAFTTTFDNVPDGTIKIAKVYTGVWGGSPGKGGKFNITVNGVTSSTYQACDPCPIAPCKDYRNDRCDALNWSGNVPPNVPSGDVHDYIGGCNVHFISYNATSLLHPGSNTVTVRASCCDNCTCWYSRDIYLIALLVVYENSSMPEITYGINEGAPYLEKGSFCDDPEDHTEASFYFNGTHVDNPEKVTYLILGWPHVFNASEAPAYTKLNDNNIGYPDHSESYVSGCYEVFVRYNDIPTGYLDASSNFVEYHDPDAWYERAFAAVLMVEGPGGQPDLVVTDINAYHYNTRSSPWFNLSNEVDVTVKNNGSVDAGAFNVSLFADAELIGKQEVSGLEAGSSAIVQFKCTPIGEDCFVDCTFTDTFRDYEFKAVADCDSDVSESNETNNNLTRVERACYNGYKANHPLENAAHGMLRGGLLFTTGDGEYGGLYSVGDTRDTNYEITIPAGASVELARLNVYYTWHYEKTSCPAMEVSITNDAGTHIVPLDKRYNDIKCQCPGAVWVFPWGNYVYDITDYIASSGTYTVTVKRTGGPSFCIAAPGIEVIYEDETKPLIEYWVNEGADILIGGRRGDGGYLSLEECINNATFKGEVNLSKVENATLGVVSPWAGSAWQPGMTNYLYFNGIELGRGVYHGYDERYSETIDSITVEINSTNAQVGVNVSNVTSYLNASINWVGQGDDGDNMMPCNAFLVVEYEEELPGDLDGDGVVTMDDVHLVAGMVIGTVKEDLKADFNGNGYVDVGDAAKLLGYVKGKVEGL